MLLIIRIGKACLPVFVLLYIIYMDKSIPKFRAIMHLLFVRMQQSSFSVIMQFKTASSCKNPAYYEMVRCSGSTHYTACDLLRIV